MNTSDRQTAPAPIANIEDFYAALAQAIDAAGPAHESLLLSKLALLLAHALNDPDRATALVAEAGLDLPQPGHTGTGQTQDRHHDQQNL